MVSKKRALGFGFLKKRRAAKRRLPGRPADSPGEHNGQCGRVNRPISQNCGGGFSASSAGKPELLTGWNQVKLLA
jgi:hypothetical protein